MDPNNNPTPNPAPNPIPEPAEPAAAGPTLETGPDATISPESAFEGNAVIAGQEPATPNAPAEVSSATDFSAASMDSTPSFSATEPLTEPDPTPVEDPAEAALKEPIKAAEPVPGSIGSAVSMPTKAKDIPSSVPTPTASPTDDPFPPAASDKKGKMSKTTLYLLIILGVVIIAALVVFLIMQLGGNNQQSNNEPNNSQVEEPKDPEPETTTYATLSCKYNYTDDELLGLASAIGGVRTFSAEYENEELVGMTLADYLEYNDESSASTAKNQLRDEWVLAFKELEYDTDPFTSTYESDSTSADVSHYALASDIDEQSASLLNISTDEDESLDMSVATMKKLYRKLGYTCEVSEYTDNGHIETGDEEDEEGEEEEGEEDEEEDNEEEE